MKNKEIGYTCYQGKRYNKDIVKIDKYGKMACRDFQTIDDYNEQLGGY